MERDPSWPCVTVQLSVMSVRGCPFLIVMWSRVKASEALKRKASRETVRLTPAASFRRVGYSASVLGLT